MIPRVASFMDGVSVCTKRWEHQFSCQTYSQGNKHISKTHGSPAKRQTMDDGGETDRKIKGTKIFHNVIKIWKIILC